MDHYNCSVSVIVTAYNIEKYIEKCILSIIRQSYDSMEIIIIDDGSEDSTGSICDSLAKSDNRIRVIHQENRGLVNARKRGVEICSGKYIVPVDGDDEIDTRMIGHMIDEAEKHDADIVSCGMFYINEDGEKTQDKDPLDNGVYDLSKYDCKVFDYLFWDPISENRGIRSNLCSCLFRREIYLENQNKVPDLLINGEDDACFYPCVFNSNRYVYIDNPYYWHFLRKGSMARDRKRFNLEQITMIDNLIRPFVVKDIHREKLEWRYGKYLFTRLNEHFYKGHGCVAELNYKFPHELIPKGCTIIVYGAGLVGQSIIEQNKDFKWFVLSVWIDTYFKGYRNGIEVRPLEDIITKKYDYIYLAVCKERNAKNMTDALVKLGVDKKQILWEQPVRGTSTYYSRFDIE